MFKQLLGFKIKFKELIGTIKSINLKKEKYYADNINYFKQAFYEIEILTDDMYTITIYPIANGTIKELLNAKRIIKQFDKDKAYKI